MSMLNRPGPVGAVVLILLTLPTATSLVNLPSLPGVGPEQVPGSDVPPGPGPVRAPPPEAPPHEAPGASESGTALPFHHPYGRLLHRITSDKAWDVERLALYHAEYMHGVGFNSITNSLQSFEENATISYTYPLGDIDGDGYDDVLLDSYCTDPEPCLPYQGRTNLFDPAGSLRQLPQCRWPHQAWAQSGKTGAQIWNRSLDRSSFTGNVNTGTTRQCVMDYVVGVFPHENGTNDILMYRVSITMNVGLAAEITHNVYVVDGPSNVVLWRKEVKGYLVSAFGAYVMGWNFLLNPILQSTIEPGVRLIPTGTQSGLLLQSVGFNITGAGMPVALPYATDYYTIFSSYQPNEWASAIDLQTGRTLWRRDTFQPSERIPMSPIQIPKDHPGPKVPISNRTVIPYVLQDPYQILESIPPPNLNPEFAPMRTEKWHWGYKPCCFDLTGDGIPDLLYTVLEATTTPMTNYEGPYGIDERIVLFDGATGNLVWDHYVERDLETDFGVAFGVQFLGDADGDGTSDFLLHQRYFNWDYEYDVSVREGRTGAELWRFDSPREHDTLVLGDADGDGGNDIAIVDYTFDLPWAGDGYSRANLTHTPIKVFSGADGTLLMRRSTFQTPSDLLFIHELFRLNGLLDADGDGAGDLLIDDPLFLPDLTTVHRYTVVSSRTNESLFSYLTAGVFSFPSLIGDVDGDGVQDYLVLNGDVLDLWITTYHGQNGTALWSRRLMTTKSGSYLSAAPQLRLHRLQHDGPGGDDFLLNFHYKESHITSIGGFFFFFYQSTKPQMVRYVGGTGDVAWAMPAIHDVNLTVVVDGMSPASRMFAAGLLFDSKTDRVPPEPLVTPAQGGIGAAAFAAAFGLSFALLARRRRA